jgi:hypothetical protein
MKLSLIIVLIATVLFAAEPGEDLQVAARRGQLAEVKKLLDAGAPLESKNQYGATPLYLAVFNGHTEVALFLLEKGANPNVTDTFYKSSILDSALQKERAEIVKALIARGVPVSPRQLNMVVGGGNTATLQAVLTAPFKPEDLTAALKAAIQVKKDDAAAILRKAGAVEPKIVNVSKETLASYAGDYVSAAIPLGLKIIADGDKLKGQGDGQPEFPLSTDSPTEFSFAMAGIRIVFDGKGGFMLNQGGRDFAFVKKGSASAPVTRKVPDTTLAAYNGAYSTTMAPMEIKVSGTDGQLYIEPTGQQRIPLKSESDTEFTFGPAGLKLVFAKSAFTLFQGGKEIPFTKKDAQ